MNPPLDPHLSHRPDRGSVSNYFTWSFSSNFLSRSGFLTLMSTWDWDWLTATAAADAVVRVRMSRCHPSFVVAWPSLWPSWTSKKPGCTRAGGNLPVLWDLIITESHQIKESQSQCRRWLVGRCVGRGSLVDSFPSPWWSRTPISFGAGWGRRRN